MIESPRPRDYRVRLNTFDWDALGSRLWEHGYARLPRIFSPEECGALVALYGEEALFRGVIELARHRSGRGQYKFFSYPLPPMIETLREHAYRRLAPLASRWNAALFQPVVFPGEHSEFLAQCRANGQTLPTALLRRYREGDYHCLHQDLFGEIYFPFQMMFLLSEPEVDFTGGEFILAEQMPHSQPSIEIVDLRQGDAVIFTTRFHPVKSTRGLSRAAVRHGVSVVRDGQRFTMGILFHDAR